MTDEITIPRELAERLMNTTAGDFKDCPQIALVDELTTHLYAQLHPKPQPWVGDVKKRDGWLYVRCLRPPSDNGVWLCVTADDIPRADATMAELPVLLNINDHLDALKEGPVVVLTEEAAYYLKGHCVNRDPDLGRRIDDALAAYRQREQAK